eukprot:COSAG01_NODE_25909_length_729_cov_2.101587_2_plen_213_part_01
MAVAGDTAVIGAHYDDDGGSDSGSAYAFVRVGTSWSQQAKLTASDAVASDYFGYSVAAAGDTAVIGAMRNDDGGSDSGSAYTYSLTVCTATALPSDDGSAGPFYCVNGGTVSGFAGSCTCTSCNAGYWGSSCHIASACVATAVSTDDGSNGNFYCINFGSIGGTTGSCTCSPCAVGYSGSSCQTANACASTQVANSNYASSNSITGTYGQSVY